MIIFEIKTDVSLQYVSETDMIFTVLLELARSISKFD